MEDEPEIVIIRNAGDDWDLLFINEVNKGGYHGVTIGDVLHALGIKHKLIELDAQESL